MALIARGSAVSSEQTGGARGRAASTRSDAPATSQIDPHHERFVIAADLLAIRVTISISVRTGSGSHEVDIDVDDVELRRDVLGHENVIGAKDSSGNLQNFKSYRDAAPDWSMLIGSGAALLGALELGAVGGIVAVANFACELAVEVAEAFFRADYETAREAQNRLGRLHTEIVDKWGPAGVKAAMDAVGLAGGNVRAPLVDLTDRERSTVVELLTATDLQH